jgi:hypothetical protein
VQTLTASLTLSAANPFASDEEVFMFIPFPEDNPERIVNTDAIVLVEEDYDCGGVWITALDGSKIYLNIPFEEFKKRITQ